MMNVDSLNASCHFGTRGTRMSAADLKAEFIKDALTWWVNNQFSHGEWISELGARTLEKENRNQSISFLQRFRQTFSNFFWSLFVSFFSWTSTGEAFLIFFLALFTGIGGVFVVWSFDCFTFPSTFSFCSAIFARRKSISSRSFSSSTGLCLEIIDERTAGRRKRDSEKTRRSSKFFDENSGTIGKKRFCRIDRRSVCRENKKRVKITLEQDFALFSYRN